MYDFKKIESKWQDRWDKSKIFETKLNSKKKKFYNLEMFPYPSGSLHMGHARNYSMGDAYARFKRMQGFNVLYPMGYDAFGLPAENAAIKSKINPKKWTFDNIALMKSQQIKLGLSYDWDREIATCLPEYYKWNQYIFLQFYKKGLAYRKEALVNFCSSCKTVLANEQVINGKCWRCNNEIELKSLEQWFFKITNYAEELLKDLEKLDWPEKVKIMQKNWIGKSEGTLIKFKLENVKPKVKLKFNPRIIQEILNGESFLTFRLEHKNISKEDVCEFLNSKDNKKFAEAKIVNVSKKKFKDIIPSEWKHERFTTRQEMYKTYEKYYKKPVNENTDIYIYEFKLIKEECLEVFTTRPDTLYGATFLVIAPEHPKVLELVKNTRYEDEVKKFINKVVLEDKFLRTAEDKEKYGMFIGKYAMHPLTHEKIPIYIANFVLLDYGTGIIMAVPAHDQRDFEFAKKYKIPIKVVIQADLLGAVAGVDKKFESDFDGIKVEYVFKDNAYFIKSNSAKKEQVISLIQKNMKKGFYSDIYINGEVFVVLPDRIYNISKENELKKAQAEINKLKVPKEYSNLSKIKNEWKTFINDKIWNMDLKRAYLDEGILINSDKFNNMESKKAIDEISKYLASLKLGKKTTQYKLRDWLISRQRYWGTPIPIIYCQNCGVIPVQEKDLPVKLPEDVKFTGEGNPLASSKTFVNVKCIKCGKMAKRETDTMDTFVDSSWYFLRYCDPDNNKLPFSKDNINYFMPVNQYTGGIEHAILHLLYARFFTKSLRDLGLLKFNEPFLRLVNQGMVLKNGEVMSKSKGNIVDPMEIINKYGADTLRTFILFIASPEKEFNWSEEGLEGIFRFLNKFYALQENISKKSDEVVESKLNKLIKKVTQEIEEFRFNNAIISIMEFSEYIKKHNYDKDVLEKLILLTSLFAPHLGEEIWEKLGNKGFISLASWPKADEKKINEELEKQEENLKRTVDDINNIKKLVNINNPKTYIYCIPKEIKLYEENKEFLKNVTNSKLIEVFAVNDKGKYDPKNKANKAKIGKPAIFLE